MKFIFEHLLSLNSKSVSSQDLSDFLNHTHWFFDKPKKIRTEAGTAFSAPQEFNERFPRLSQLLRQARTTNITYESQHYILFGWTDSNSESFGWLCPTPLSNKAIIKSLHPDHALLLQSFGGITETWNTPEISLLLNLNSALTYDEAQEGFSEYELLLDACEREGVDVTIDPKNYVSFAFEANGNSTMYEKQSSDVLMFANDHTRNDVTRYQDYPEFTLYAVNDGATLRDWAEHVARQYLCEVKTS